MRDGAIYAAISDKPQLKELAAKDAEIERLRAALQEIARVGTWLGTDDVTYTSQENRIATEALNQQETIRK